MPVRSSRLLGIIVSTLVASASTAQAADGPACVALTRGFCIDVFVKRNADAAMQYAPTYIQHVARPSQRSPNRLRPADNVILMV